MPLAELILGLQDLEGLSVPVDIVVVALCEILDQVLRHLLHSQALEGLPRMGIHLGDDVVVLLTIAGRAGKVHLKNLEVRDSQERGLFA